MGPEAIAFHRSPSHLQPGRTLVARTDTVLPHVIGGEIAARPPQQRDVQLPSGVEHITAIAVRVGEWRLLFEDAALDASPQMFDEVAVNLGIDIADHTLGIDLDTSLDRSR